MIRLPKRLGAAVAIAAVAVVGLPGLATPVPAKPAIAPANIDPSAEGTLTITADARVDESGEIRPIEGVEFTVQKVTTFNGSPVELTTPEGWAAIEGIDARDITETDAGVVLDDVESQVTDKGGKVVFDLDIGLYYVTQTDSPGGVAAGAVPFLVTIPYPHESTAGGWRYHVEAFPKSATATANKSVADGSAFALGDRVTWTLTGSVPAVPSGETLTRYVITDELDERLKYVPESVQVTTEPDAALGTEDYTVSYADRTLTVELTGPGLEELAEIASPDAALTVTFDTEVVAIGDGIIRNTAAVTIGEATFAPDAVTEWGAVEIYKYVLDDKSAPLAGAVFEVYQSEHDARTGENAVEILVDGEHVSEFTTDDQGQVLLPGFLAGVTVYLVETKAPAGYIASGVIDPVRIRTGVQRVEVANEQRTGVDLPVLGAQGMAVAGLLGLGLMGAGTGLAVVSKRRKANGNPQ